ncbi:MAG TPA: hypothetical protein VFZ48_05785 [Candidatus Saccharimonadales bacterium]
MLLAEDRLQLHPQFRIYNHTIVDSLLGAQHHLSPKGYRLGKQLEQGTTYKDLLATSDRAAIRQSELTELLGFLNKQGALIRKRSLPTTIKTQGKVIAGALLGVRYEPVSRRSPASPLGLTVAVLRVCRVPAFLSIALGVLLTTGMASPPGHTWATIGAGLSIFLLSIGLHELCHILIARAQTKQTAIVQNGMRIGIVHPVLPNPLELYSAIAGPLAGAAFALMAGAITSMFSPYVLPTICALVCCLHLCGLLPWYSDGSTMATVLKRRKL